MNISQRLYYTDAYTTKFKAQVMERIHRNGRTAVILDRTFFYPTSGGQPFDQGQMNKVPVVNVSIRKEDNAILHWLDSELWSDVVTAEIDWQRRFDHMQQHTGQHILSQAFIQVAQAITVGFHLSPDTVTIDLHTNELTPAQVEQAEFLANQIIWQNRPVYVHLVTPEQAQKLPLRKLPPLENGKLRLIDIENFDLTACGGTHVARTGEIGLIKIVKLERRGQQLRVEFGCGKRALFDYRLKNSIVNNLAATLTTGYAELIPAVTRLQEEVKETRRTLKKQQSELLSIEAARLLEEGTRKGKITIITHVFTELSPEQLRDLGNQLMQDKTVIALLGLAGPKSQLLFCRSDDAPGQMNHLIKPALQVLGSAAGGGTDRFAQGGGPEADEERVRQAVARAERLLLGQIRTM